MQMNRRLNIRRYCSPVLSSFSLTCMLIGGFIVLLSLSSCNEDSEPESNSFYVQCYIDSIGQITTIEGIMSKSIEFYPLKEKAMVFTTLFLSM